MRQSLYCHAVQLATSVLQTIFVHPRMRCLVEAGITQPGALMESSPALLPYQECAKNVVVSLFGRGVNGWSSG